MTRVAAWWRRLSAPDKFRFYTRLTLQVGSVVAAVAICFSGPFVGGGPWPVAAVVVSAIAGTAGANAQPQLVVPQGARVHRWVVPGVIAVLLAVWVTSAVIARSANDPEVALGATLAGLVPVIFASVVVVPFLRYRWWILLAVSIVTAAMFADWPNAFWGALIIFCSGGFALALMIMTLWSLRLFDDLERTKDVEAELHLAEERLRFARDLHDVVGRGFSAIAVKSELAVALARAGEMSAATTEMDQVKTLAVESMEQMRGVVRGYRDIDLAGEVDGARSLLSAAGCRLDVQGDPAKVPERFHEVAAWVVREGTTNIVRHSSATSATLTLGTAGMTLRNNGVDADPGERSGLRGLAERLAAVGATLHTGTSGGEFLLDIQWETA